MRITTLNQLHVLQSNTYVYAFIIVFVTLAISFLISNLIPYQGGQDKSYIKRRWVFIIFGIISSSGFYLYNDLVIKEKIVNIGFKNMFVHTNLYCLAITLGTYIVLGIILMFIVRKSKFGSILGRIKE